MIHKLSITNHQPHSDRAFFDTLKRWINDPENAAIIDSYEDKDAKQVYNIFAADKENIRLQYAWQDHQRKEALAALESQATAPTAAKLTLQKTIQTSTDSADEPKSDQTERSERNLKTLVDGVSIVYGSELEDLDTALVALIKTTCAAWKWGTNKGLLIELDWAKEKIRDPSRAIHKWMSGKYPEFNRSAAPVQLAPAPSATPVAWTEKRLGWAIHAHLQNNPDRDYSYNDLALELSADWKMASKECGALVKDSTSGVIKFTKQVKGKDKTVFRYMPERKQMENGDLSPDAAIRIIVLDLIKETPGIKSGVLRDATRDRLLSLSNDTFNNVLKDMIAAGEVVEKVGMQRARLHFLPS